MPATLSLAADTSDIHRTLVSPRYGVAKVFFDTTGGGQLEGVLLFEGQPMRFGVLDFKDGQTGWVGETGRLWVQGFTKAGTYEGVWTNGSEQKKCSVVLSGQPLLIEKAVCF